MPLQFSERPGRHERQFMRKYDNPLFGEDRQGLPQAALREAQRLDHEELEAYIRSLRRLVGEAIALGPHEQSDIILDLKERLDKAYETACRLADDQTPNKEAIRKLVAVIMRAVWKGAGDDSLARRQLEQEEEARESHYQLLEHPLVADLLDPDSLIGEAELLPMLLSVGEADFEAAVGLFDRPQLTILCNQGETLLARLRGGESAYLHRQRLDALKARLAGLDRV
jgi:hypothetical protein